MQNFKYQELTAISRKPQSNSSTIDPATHYPKRKVERAKKGIYD